MAEFARGQQDTGHSPHFHVEGPTLMVDRMDPAALRIGSGSVLVRLDLPDDVFAARPMIEAALTAVGMSLLDPDTLLAAPVAIQVLGLRQSDWDLWGDDLEAAFACLRSSAVGEQSIQL